MFNKKTMFWVFFGVTVFYLMVNSPLIYSLIFVHKIGGISKLWGYAPNQFLFSVVIFPVSCLFSFLAFTYFIKDLYAKVPLNSRITYFFDHYPIFFLICVIVSCLVTITVYYTSAWSFDKLEPQYTERTLLMIREFEKQVENETNKRDEQENVRKRIIGEAKDNLQNFQQNLPSNYDKDEINKNLESLKPAEYLQVMHNRDLTFQLRLVNPKIKVLNILQMFMTILVASFLVFVTGICLSFANEIGYDGTNHPELNQIFKLIFWAVFYFSLYVICFKQYRQQIEEIVGTGTTILQDVLVLLVVLALLFGIKYAQTHKFEFSLTGITPFIPLVFPFVGITVESLAPDMMKQYLGSETTLGFQIIGSVIFLALSFIPLFLSLKGG